MQDQRIFRWAALCVATLGICALWNASTPSADANAITQTGRATNMATINVARVLELLEERTDREQELMGEISDREATINAMTEQLKAIRADLEVMENDTPQRREKVEEGVRLSMQLEFENNFATRVLEVQRKEMQLALFNKIKSATQAYAGAEGWDLVLVTDHETEIPASLGPNETRGAILSRRVLSVNESIDITDEVARRMNNEYSR